MPSVVIEASEEVGAFITDALKESGMQFPDRDSYNKMIISLYAGLNQCVFAQVTNHMPEEYMGTFVKMTEQKKPQAELERFIREHVPNAGEVIARGFTDFRKNVLDLAGEMLQGRTKKI